jgi:3,4-dihydroxy-9,10-secoandrosta-1,3,5(10)-triene-9,17-dione 4,5-dioxygenase
MDVRGLGYLVIEATDLAAWQSFGTEVLGLALGRSAPAGSQWLKMDERPFRIALVEGAEDRLLATGWELASARELDEAVDELEGVGVMVERGSPEDAAARRVRGLLRFVDPGGASIELFHAPVQDHDVFVSPAGVSGFVTGALGMGHVVMLTPEFDRALAFYTGVLGFRESDWMDLNGMQLAFLHCNARHHSVALAAADGSAPAHFMVEAASVDDVGYALDRFADHGIRLKQGLGRHSNDQMLSFYAATPARFDVEFGCGGIHIDDATWTSQEITKTSFWGHRRPPKLASG